MTERMKRLQAEAIYVMLHYHEKTGKQKVKDLLKKAAGRYVSPKDYISWPTGLIANALMENYERWENKDEVLSALEAYFDFWIKNAEPIYCIDDALCGTALLALYKLTGAEKYRAGADKIAAYLYKIADEDADEKGSLPYRPSQKNNHIYVDGIGMMCPFLCEYGVTFGDDKAILLCIKQIKNMLEYGMDEDSFLPYHGYMYESKVKYGIIGWGRAVGWLLMGIAGSLHFLPKEHLDYISLKEVFQRIADSAYYYQKANGAFAWQLEAQEGPQDSSATAMITSAILKGIQTGIIDGSENAYGKKVRASAEFLAGCEKDGKIFVCSGECKGFSEYPQIYGAYPWSLGPGLNVLLQKE